jgi:hypothetical protein
MENQRGRSRRDGVEPALDSSHEELAFHCDPPLARTGDFPLGGGTFDRFSGLSSSEGPVINDAGQVVFLAILADGRRGVFVVEPTTLPIQIP